MLLKDREVGNVPGSVRTPRFISRPGVFDLQQSVVSVKNHRMLEEHDEPRPLVPVDGHTEGRCKWPLCNANRKGC